MTGEKPRPERIVSVTDGGRGVFAEAWSYRHGRSREIFVHVDGPDGWIATISVTVKPEARA